LHRCAHLVEEKHLYAARVCAGVHILEELEGLLSRFLAHLLDVVVHVELLVQPLIFRQLPISERKISRIVHQRVHLLLVKYLLLLLLFLYQLHVVHRLRCNARLHFFLKENGLTNLGLTSQVFQHLGCILTRRGKLRQVSGGIGDT